MPDDGVLQRLEKRIDKLEERIEKKLDQVDATLKTLSIATALLDTRARIWAAFASFIIGAIVAYLVDLKIEGH